MRGKTSLVLMEVLVMVLVFSLAAAACLRCFVWADRTAEETQQKDQAVILAQNAAEAVKICGGDIPAAREMVAIPQGLCLEITPLSSEIPGLGEAEIAVNNDAQERVFSLVIAWQEDTP